MPWNQDWNKTSSWHFPEILSQPPAIFSLFPFWAWNCHFVCSSPQLTYLVSTCPLVFESLCNFSIHSIPQHNYTFCVESSPLLSFTSHFKAWNCPQSTRKDTQTEKMFSRMKENTIIFPVLFMNNFKPHWGLFPPPTLFDKFWNWNDYFFPVLKCYL